MDSELRTRKLKSVSFDIDINSENAIIRLSVNPVTVLQFIMTYFSEGAKKYCKEANIKALFPDWNNGFSANDLIIICENVGSPISILADDIDGVPYRPEISKRNRKGHSICVQIRDSTLHVFLDKKTCESIQRRHDPIERTPEEEQARARKAFIQAMIYRGRGKDKGNSNITSHEGEPLDYDYVIDLIDKCGGTCYSCKDPVLYEGGLYCCYKLSIDRINNNKGHVKGNVRISCYFCNCRKNYAFTQEYKVCNAGCHTVRRYIPGGPENVRNITPTP
jgi:hypothetical protein